MLTTHLCLVQRLRMSGTVPVFFLFAIISCSEQLCLYFLCILFTESAFYSFSTHMMAVQIGYIASEDAVVAYQLMKAPLILCDFNVKEDVKGN